MVFSGLETEKQITLALKTTGFGYKLVWMITQHYLQKNGYKVESGKYLSK